jgi:WD40 repeat protein
LNDLDGKALVPRRDGVRWKDCVEGGERRLMVGQDVLCVAWHGRHVCVGHMDGSIGVWSASRLELERTLTGHKCCAQMLVFAGGLLISSSLDRMIRVWDIETGRCEGVLEGQTRIAGELALAASGSMLFSGTEDGTVRVWRMEGEASSWTCKRTLDGQGMFVQCLQAWEGKVACGTGDGGIRVWVTETWALEQTL